VDKVCERGVTKVENFDKKRFVDLAARSYRNNQFTFTGFLGLAEYSDLQDLLRLPGDNPDHIDVRCVTAFGGYEGAERVMARFGDPEDMGYEQPFPLCCITIKPLMDKFADELSHRDFLGALMNLGIERSELGDILVRDNSCCLIAKESMAELICRELTRVKHTSVMTEVSERVPQAMEPRLEAATIQAKSGRIDSFVAKVCKLSRSDAAGLFVAGKIFVNGRLMSNESYQLKEGDIISVRGWGRLKFGKAGGSTRKGNLILNYERYV